jgi:DmsE family decaheme c-type cytochrome
MHSFSHGTRAGLTFGLIVAAASLAGVVTASTARQDAKAPPPSGYAGEETCLTCHEQQAYKGTGHARVANPRTPAAAQGCESCHGPGQAHVDSGGDAALIGSYKTMTPDTASETCTTCHNRQNHGLWDGSAHDRRDMSCMSCHSIHSPKSEQWALLAENETKLCVTCHRNTVAKQQRSGHMPVFEGKMACSSCHNVHGTQNVRLLREGNSITESCATCHADKRGPFLWEHAPGRQDCTVCHDPHGSNNERMLVAKQPMLCQRCHIHTRHPSTVYDGTTFFQTRSNRAVGRSCVNCHSMIHGSNHPTAGKMFTR